MKKQYLPVLVLSGLALAASPAHAIITVYSDNFNGGAVDLHDTTPDTGANKWVATSANFLADGTLGGTGAGTATLAFAPTNGMIYTLEATFSGIAGDGNWIPFGFVNGQGTSTATSGTNENRFLEAQTTGIAWMFARGTNDLIANANNTNNAFLGVKNDGGDGNGLTSTVAWSGALSDADGGNLDFRIVLDTTGGTGAWAATWYAKRDTDGSYTEVRPAATLLEESIDAVGFGKSNTNVTGTITNFSLTSVPEPSAALLGLAGTLLLLRRKRA